MIASDYLQLRAFQAAVGIACGTRDWSLRTCQLQFGSVLCAGAAEGVVLSYGSICVCVSLFSSLVFRSCHCF